MTTVDLSAPTPPDGGPLDDLPRRVTLTLPELRRVAQAAGDAPLPFDTQEPVAESGLEGRLGQSRGSVEAQAYADALDSLRDPGSTLGRRGLLIDDVMDSALIGAVGLLATPEVALDVDVSITPADQPATQVKTWHRQSGEAVASLSTCDGIVFELAWFPTRHWPSELERVGALPQDLSLAPSAAPRIDLPYELLDAAAEAIGSHRPDLLAVLARQLTGTLIREDDLIQILGGLTSESRGRLRALVARTDVRSDRPVGSPDETVIGVVSWVLLSDGWRSLSTHLRDDALWVDVRPVQARDLAADLAPVLAEATT